MDSFTHSLFPFLSGKIARKNKEICAALLIGGLAPDFDLVFLFVNMLFNVPESFLLVHRGITHTIIFGIITSWIVLFIASRKRILAALNYLFKSNISLSITSELIFYASFGTLSHLLLDYITTYGIILAYPFITKRYSLELFFYIDVYLTIIGMSIVGFALYRKKWFKAPFGTNSTLEIESTYRKLFFVLVAALLFFGGLRYYEKTVSAEYLGADVGAVYPSFNPYVWNVAKPSEDNKKVTIYKFDSKKKEILSQYEIERSAFERRFPQHRFLVDE